MLVIRPFLSRFVQEIARISIADFGTVSVVLQGRSSKTRVCHTQKATWLFSALRIKCSLAGLDKIDRERSQAAPK
jgi:hypothetical protein